MVMIINLILVASITRVALALPICLDRGINQISSIVELAAEIEDSDTRRQRVPDYADAHDLATDQAAQKFAPTGTLKCRGTKGSGSLVGKSDLVIASLHSLVDWKTCKVHSTPEECTFQIEGHEPVRVKGMAGTGNKCPQTNQFDGDWVLLTLERPVKGVIPYKYRKMTDRDTFGLQNVVAVGAQSVDFKYLDPKSKRLIYPKHVQNCPITRIFYRYNPYGLATKCDFSPGSSGGALLDSNLTEPTIVGLIIGVPFTPEEREKEIKTGVPIRKRYDENKWFGTGMAIFGDLYDALDKAAP